MNKRFTLFTEKSIFCHKIDCLRVLLHEFTVLRGTFVLLLNMHMYIDMIFFLFINLRKRLTILNFELMRWDEISYCSIFMIYISISVLAVCLNISTQIYVTILLL